VQWKSPVGQKLDECFYEYDKFAIRRQLILGKWVVIMPSGSTIFSVRLWPPVKTRRVRQRDVHEADEEYLPPDGVLAGIHARVARIGCFSAAGGQLGKPHGGWA
jgi:hypothetical protein